MQSGHLNPQVWMHRELIPMTQTFINFVNQTFSLAMKMNKNVICFGLGVTDPKGVFGSTLNLEKNLVKKEYLMCLHLKIA